MLRGIRDTRLYKDLFLIIVYLINAQETCFLLVILRIYFLLYFIAFIFVVVSKMYELRIFK